MTRTVLILGAHGKIGRHFAAAFAAGGWRVKRYARGTDMAAAAQGCDVIANGLNPPAYHDWQTILPRITEQVIGAAKASGATILFPGNVYVFGTQPGPWSETTPHRPCSRKGEIRAQIEARYRAAAREGVRTILLRAGDYLTPEVSDSFIDAVYLRGFAKGRITTLGDPAVGRAHAWLPDMARAGLMLAEKRAALEPFTDVPFPGYTLSADDIAQALSRLTGRALRVKLFPWWLFSVTAPVWELAREMKEMRYLYSTPHRLDDALFTRLLPEFRATPLQDALAEILARREIAARAA
ncbi:MAG: NAD(P)H-binding protein [Pararhodobacter sp.]